MSYSSSYIVLVKTDCPQVQDVTPLQGSVVGGTEVTITGSGFGTDKTKLNVEFGDLECAVTSVTDTLIKCKTEAADNVDQLWTEYGE